MEKLKKRLDDLELINNNVKLLNEMLSHFKPDAPEHEKQIIEVHNTLSFVLFLLFFCHSPPSLSLFLNDVQSLCQCIFLY